MSGDKVLSTNLLAVLGASNEVKRDDIGQAWLSGQELSETTNLSPAEGNDAVTLLRESGLVEWRQYLGTAPFVFGQVTIYPRGRFELERMRSTRDNEITMTTSKIIMSTRA